MCVRLVCVWLVCRGSAGPTWYMLSSRIVRPLQLRYDCKYFKPLPESRCWVCSRRRYKTTHKDFIIRLNDYWEGIWRHICRKITTLEAQSLTAYKYTQLCNAHSASYPGSSRAEKRGLDTSHTHCKWGLCTLYIARLFPAFCYLQ